MKLKALMGLLLVSSTLVSNVVMARTTVTSTADGTRSVGNAVWKKTESVDAEQVIAQGVPAYTSRVFFLRRASSDSVQTSANVAINDRFQVSLQPGNFSSVYGCVGINAISAELTGYKNNDLSKNALFFKFEPQVSYFFIVDVNSNGTTSLKQITKTSALDLMRTMQQQTHQISRVVPNCQPAPEPVVAPPAPVYPSVYETIELQVLFDNDKAFVKSKYYSEIERVADFMKRHPESTVTLEGHTDSNASAAYNVSLSQRRVDAVKKILVQKYGISAERVNSVGYGKSRPVATNATSKGRQQNRRVVAVFSVNK